MVAGRVSASVHDEATAPSQWFRDYGRSFLRGYLYNQRREGEREERGTSSNVLPLDFPGDLLYRLSRLPLAPRLPPNAFLFPSFSYYFLVFSWQTSPFARFFFLLARAKDPSERLIDWRHGRRGDFRGNWGRRRAFFKPLRANFALTQHFISGSFRFIYAIEFYFLIATSKEYIFPRGFVVVPSTRISCDLVCDLTRFDSIQRSLYADRSVR